jgi:hypothetical protein
MKLEFPSRGVAILAIREIIGCINACGLITNVAAISAVVLALETWYGS